MIDAALLRYRLVAILPTGERLDITKLCEEIQWSEQEKELSSTISFSAFNAREAGGQWLSERLRPNTILVVLSNYAGGWDEVARGRLNVWEPSESNDECILEGETKDVLFDVQRSQEYRYIPGGMTTRAIIGMIFGAWGLQIGVYNGPNVAHDKKVIKNDYIGDTIMELFKDAEKKGARKCFCRARGDVIDIIPRGTNTEVYSFKAAANVTNVSGSINVQKIVTRVVIMSKADDDERSYVEATLDGQTQYGIHQKVITRAGEQTLAEARQSAQETLEEEGKPEEKYKLTNVPDVPPMRKGDKLKIHAGVLDGWYYVKSITHYAHKRTMTLIVEPADDLASGSGAAVSDVGHKSGKILGKVTPDGRVEIVDSIPENVPGFVDHPLSTGDKVLLNGYVYTDSYGRGRGNYYSGQECEITMEIFTSRPCPYHVDRLGWVHPEDLTLVERGE